MTASASAQFDERLLKAVEAPREPVVALLDRARCFFDLLDDVAEPV